MRGIALVGMLACAGALAVAAGPKDARAAETHSNCATFDNQGNILSVTPSCTETIQSDGGPPQSMPAIDPCTGDTGTLTILTRRSMFHVTVNGAGDVWVTGSQNGTVTFTPDNPSAPSGSGPWASWFGGSQNNRSSVMHDTFHAEIQLTNGQKVSVHMVDHVTINGTGTVTSQFSKGGAPTCG